MRRGFTSKPANRLARVALAYLLALQAVLGAWAGAGLASPSAPFDPALTLCRTQANDAQHPGSDAPALPPHCVLMCLSGACGAGDPPAAVVTKAELLPPAQAPTSLKAVRELFRAATPLVRLSARGPPKVA